MSWGYKILIVYCLFIVGISFMVFKSSTQKMDLVTTDYYAKELKYQQKIDQIKRVEKLSEPIDCQVVNNTLQITFPKDIEGKVKRGEVTLYCPSDESKDFKKNFDLKNNLLMIPLPKNSFGQYEIHLFWVMDNEEYYHEKKLFI